MLFSYSPLGTSPVTGKVPKDDKSEDLGSLVDFATGGMVPVIAVWNCICGTEVGVGNIIKGYNLSCSITKCQPVGKIACILPFAYVLNKCQLNNIWSNYW